MNLVDAIRQAASKAQEAGSFNAAHFVERTSDEPIEEPVEVVETVTSGSSDSPSNTHQARTEHVEAETTGGIEEEFPTGPGLNLVRMELFLTPEQMSAMLRGALTSHRSVMTLRDAASYLRTSSASLEKLAEDGELPGFKIEGAWRFLKATIDDWVAIQAQFGNNHGGDRAA